MEDNKTWSNKDTEATFHQVVNRVSVITILANAVLSVFKLMAGVIAHSNAMISDAVHSASDVFSTVVVIIGVKLASKESDKEHPYGHERLECVAAIVLAMVLLFTGLEIGLQAIRAIIKGNYSNLEVPGMLALIAAIISIVVKELMYWYTRHYAKKIDSSAVMADAWHHRSDALSSVGALIGIGGARLGFPIMEPLASVVICIFIEKAAFDIFKDAIDKMVDKIERVGCKIPSKEQQIQYLVSNIQLACERTSIHKVCIVSTEKCDNEELLDTLKNELKKLSVELIYCSDVNYSSEALMNLSQCGNAIIMEEQQKSYYKEIRNEVGLCKENKINILGSILVEN